MPVYATGAYGRMADSDAIDVGADTCVIAWMVDCIGAETEVSIVASAVVSVATDTAKGSDCPVYTEYAWPSVKEGGCLGGRWREVRRVRV